MGKNHSKSILTYYEEFDAKLKIDPEKISIVRAITSGNFGSVFFGKLEKNGKEISGWKDKYISER